MDPRESHFFIQQVLWILKFPEVISTGVTIVGFILFGLGIVPVSIPFFAFCTRLLLFFLRIGIVKIKRNLEKTHRLSRTTYIPSIIKKGTQKVEFIKYK